MSKAGSKIINQKRTGAINLLQKRQKINANTAKSTQAVAAHRNKIM